MAKTVHLTNEAHKALSLHKAKIGVATLSEAVLDLTLGVERLVEMAEEMERSARTVNETRADLKLSPVTTVKEAVNLAKGVYGGKRK